MPKWSRSFHTGTYKDEVAKSPGFHERDYTHAINDVWGRLYDLQQENQR